MIRSIRMKSRTNTESLSRHEGLIICPLIMRIFQFWVRRHFPLEEVPVELKILDFGQEDGVGGGQLLIDDFWEVLCTSDVPLRLDSIQSSRDSTRLELTTWRVLNPHPCELKVCTLFETIIEILPVTR